MADGVALGCAATLVDVVTSAALVTVSKRSGVSLSISVDYLSPGTGGEEVEVDARVRHPFNTLGFLRVSDIQGRAGRGMAGHTQRR